MSNVAGQNEAAGASPPAAQGVDAASEDRSDNLPAETAGETGQIESISAPRQTRPQDVGLVLADRDPHKSLAKALRVAQKRLDVTEREAARLGLPPRPKARQRRTVEALIRAINRKCQALHDQARDDQDYFQRIDRVRYEARACSGGREEGVAGRHDGPDAPPADQPAEGLPLSVQRDIASLRPGDEMLFWMARQRLFQLVRVHLDDQGRPRFTHDDDLAGSGEGKVRFEGRLIRLAREVIEEGLAIRPGGATAAIVADINGKCRQALDDVTAGRILEDRYLEIAGRFEREAWLRTDGVFHALEGMDDPSRSFLDSLPPGAEAILWARDGRRFRYLLAGRNREGAIWIRDAAGVEPGMAGLTVLSAIEGLRLNRFA